MSEQRDPNDVQERLEQGAQGAGDTARTELVFDPRTGQLVVDSRPSPDAVVATDIAEQGFFAG